MGNVQHIVTGTLRDDGTVLLDCVPSVPPGRVRLRIEAEAGASPVAPTPGARERAAAFRAAMAELRAAQRTSGHTPRSAAEIDAEINALRDESELEFRETEDLQTRLREAKLRGARVS